MPGPSVMSLRARMVLYLSLRAVARAIQTMSRPGPNSTSENRRVRALLSSLCALCCLLPLSSWAGRPVRVYEVDVDGQSCTASPPTIRRSEEHTSELQSLRHLVCRLLLEKKKTKNEQST